jgi:hypothetical protein
MTTLRTATYSLDLALDGDFGYANELPLREAKIFKPSNHHRSTATRYSQ